MSKWNLSEEHKVVLTSENQLMLYIISIEWGFPGGASGKHPACQGGRHKRCGFDPSVGKIRWRRAWQSTPVFLPGESLG